jgi:hypothetical protein
MKNMKAEGETLADATGELPVSSARFAILGELHSALGYLSPGLFEDHRAGGRSRSPRAPVPFSGRGPRSLMALSL